MTKTEKIKFLRITFKPLSELINDSKEALKEYFETGKPCIQPKDLFMWASVEAYQKFMSDQKYSILAAIYKFKPKSVYQLSKILGRAQQNVARDCTLLAGHGFIKFKAAKGSRKSKAPVLAFDYNAIIVFLPNVSYQIAFEQTAA